MAITANNTTPTSGSASLLTRTPGGSFNLAVTNTSGGVVYLGSSSAITSSNGCPLPNNTVLNLSGVPTCAASAIWVILGSGSASGPVGYMITTPE